MAAKEPGQVAYEAWIHCYFMAGHSACDSWPDLAERERAAWAAAEQWAQGSLSLHPTNQPLPPTERADEVTERISHEEARLAVFETRPANTKLLQAYITQQQALEADTVSRAELEKAIDWEVKRVAAARDARLTALQAELETEKAAVQCYMADLETERARAEEAKRQLAGLRQAIEDALPSLPEEAAPQASTVAYERVPVPEAEKRLDGELRRLAPPQASTEQASPSPAAKRPLVERYTVGQVIDDELEARGGITPALAEGLGATFGVNPQLFLNLALAVELDAVDRCPGCGSGPEDPCGGDHEAEPAQPAPSPAVGDASACHDDDHLYPGDGPCNCGGEGSPMGMPQPHIKTCPQHPDYVPVDDEPAQPAPGGTERWVPKAGDRVRNTLNGLLAKVQEPRGGGIVIVLYDGEERAYACASEALEPVHDPTPSPALPGGLDRPVTVRELVEALREVGADLDVATSNAFFELRKRLEAGP